MGSWQLFLVNGSKPIWGKRKVLDDVVKLTEKIHNLEMRLRGKDEEVRQ
ncbi:hypothetical protein Godav_027631 [Gossypium davidsonii]|uniref:Uncharacterized protein n=1 Tax=Gossypium davidsonii TaxID=34287 RepID=A0A7J8RWJ0_GOSDV|nr:hypothetical protein [Gossypium davidsonii]